MGILGRDVWFSACRVCGCGCFQNNLIDTKIRESLLLESEKPQLE